ncbi:MAG: NUDIX domain-containing protein [Anaerolineae bacterium]
MKQKIRPLAICVFRDGERIFAAEGYDEVKQQFFYRPLGGRIEFGERSAQTIVRELREEIDAEVSDLRYLGTLENIFTFNGEMGHEIVLIYDGKFVDNTIYEREGMEGHEDDDELGAFRAVWRPLSFFREGHAPLYPDGLLELLDGLEG